MRYGWSIALLASGVAAGPVSAQDARHPIDIGAGDLTGSLVQLSAQTGISVATDGDLPRRRVPRLRGRMTAAAALARLLAPAGWEALRVAPRAYRLRPRALPVVAEGPAEPPADIVVTGRKRTEHADDIPGPVAIYRPGPGSGGVTGVATATRDVARSIGGLTLTDAGPGSERLFLRGVADGPFNGFSQSTVSVQLDDARIAFDGADPGLRLVDVARVEVLKGPQGPLYGTGALGGVYRIVTNRPLLDRTEGEAAIGLSQVAHGGTGPSGQGVVNLPLVADRIGLRVVGYAAVDPGWIDDDDGRRDRNRTSIRGGRVALRIAPADAWRVDGSVTRQSIDARDTRYVDRPDSYRRDVPTAEPYRGRLSSYQGRVDGPVGTMRLTIATGLTLQQHSQRHDGGRSGSGPIAVFGNRRLRVFDQEVRLASAPGPGIDWVAGAALLLARTEGDLVGLTRDGMTTRRAAADRDVTEAALFADGSVPLADRWRLGVGLRVFRAGTRNDSFGIDTAVGSARTLIGVTPNLSLSYTPTADRIVYARIATAYRPGGLDPGDDATRRYDADRVRTLDLGGRITLLDGQLALDGNLFLTRWSDIQSDYLSENGWIATRNAGRAGIVGTEWSIDWQPGRAWRVAAGATWQRPRRSDPAASPYLAMVPDLSARMAVSREVVLGAWRLTPRLSADVVGATHLGIDGAGDRRMPGRAIGRFGLTAQASRLTLALDIDNLSGVRADTFAFGNSVAARTVRYYTPYRPRTLSLAATRRF